MTAAGAGIDWAADFFGAAADLTERFPMVLRSL